MILLQAFHKFHKFFLTITLVLFLVTSTAFAAEDSLAATLLTQPNSLTQIASMNRVEATTKNIEGKIQEAIGNVRGNKKDQFMGKAKQAESKLRNAVEDIKDGNWKQKSKSVTKDIEAKTEKAIDNSIVNPNYLPGGKTKDTKSESRNPADKMKDQIRDTFK